MIKNVIWMLTAAGEENSGSLLSIAGNTALQGMLMIFGVLALLWGAVELMHYFSPYRVKKTKVKPKPESSPSVPDKEPAVSPQPVATAEPEEALDDGALIAAITAAISAAMAEEGYTGGFRVVSFKRAARRNRF